MKTHRFIVAIALLLGSAITVQAQQVAVDEGDKGVSLDTLAKPVLKVFKNLKLSGTIRTRYNASFDKHIGINGLQHSNLDDEFADNGFTIPQARLQLAGNLSEKLEVTLRVNFGDFSSTSTSKVLEYAFATYHVNPYINVRMGLMRPNFGREDDLANDFLKSFDFSNQYTAFCENGWMGYQLGVSIYGVVKAGEVPIRYFAGVYNGDGRQNFTDNDNGKQFPARVEVDFTKDLQVGVSGGVGKDHGNSVNAWGGDLNYEKQLSRRWTAEVETEYKQGNNQALFNSDNISNTSINNYMMRGAYVLPSITYKTFLKDVKGIEASFKYEYFDPNFKQNGNVRQQYVPMVGVDFAEKYALRLQFGMVIDRYNENIANTTEYNSNRFITQLQIRF